MIIAMASPRRRVGRDREKEKVYFLARQSHSDERDEIECLRNRRITLKGNGGKS